MTSVHRVPNRHENACLKVVSLTVLQVWDERPGQEDCLSAEGRLPLAQLLQLAPATGDLHASLATRPGLLGADQDQHQPGSPEIPSTVPTRMTGEISSMTSRRRQPATATNSRRFRQLSHARPAGSSAGPACSKASEGVAGASAAGDSSLPVLDSEQARGMRQPAGGSPRSQADQLLLHAADDPQSNDHRRDQDLREVDEVGHGEVLNAASILLPLKCMASQGMMPAQGQAGVGPGPFLRLRVSYSCQPSGTSLRTSNSTSDELRRPHSRQQVLTSPTLTTRTQVTPAAATAAECTAALARQPSEAKPAQPAAGDNSKSGADGNANHAAMGTPRSKHEHEHEQQHQQQHQQEMSFEPVSPCLNSKHPDELQHASGSANGALRLDKAADGSTGSNEALARQPGAASRTGSCGKVLADEAAGHKLQSSDVIQDVRLTVRLKQAMGLAAAAEEAASWSAAGRFLLLSDWGCTTDR